METFCRITMQLSLFELKLKTFPRRIPKALNIQSVEILQAIHRAEK